MNIYALNDLIKKVKDKVFTLNEKGEWQNVTDKKDRMTEQAYSAIITTLAEYNIHPPRFELIRFP